MLNKVMFSLFLVFLSHWRMDDICAVCVWCLRSDRLGWLSGASGAREGLTSLQMLLHISEAGHLIINPQCIIKPICVCAHVFVPTFQGFPSTVYATLFHLTLSISLWTTSSRSQMAGLWSALCCNKLVPFFFFFFPVILDFQNCRDCISK